GCSRRRHCGHGSATPMRGKSQTCRGGPSSLFGLRPALLAVIDRLDLARRFGKSETCRASEWQGPCTGGEFELRTDCFETETCRASEWQSHGGAASKCFGVELQDSRRKLHFIARLWSQEQAPPPVLRDALCW